MNEIEKVEVTASEPVEVAPSEVTCSNCDSSGKDCSVCHKGVSENTPL